MLKTTTLAAILTIALGLVMAPASMAQNPVTAQIPPGVEAPPDQTPPPPPPPPVPPAPAADPRGPKVEKAPTPAPAPPRAPGQLVNIRVDVTVTDQLGGKPPVTRTLSVTAADGQNASVRSNLVVPTGTGVIPTGFSLDAMPRIADGARIRLELVLDYNSTDAAGAEGGTPRSPSSIRVRQEVILENGKPLVIAQPVDAMTDRKVTVEAKATILK